MKTDLHGALSYHLTTGHTPHGDMSYARIKFVDCVHHYTLWNDNVMVVMVFDKNNRWIHSGDEMDIVCPDGRRRPLKSHSINHCKAMVEYHLNDDYPLWTPASDEQPKH